MRLLHRPSYEKDLLKSEDTLCYREDLARRQGYEKDV